MVGLLHGQDFESLQKVKETRTPSGEVVDSPGWKAEDVEPGEEKGEATRGTDVSTYRHNKVREWNGRWKERS